jgi:hypothetical protein
MPVERGHALIGRAAVTFCSWHPVIAIVSRGPGRGPSHPCKRCNQGHQWHCFVASAASTLGAECRASHNPSVVSSNLASPT